MRTSHCPHARLVLSLYHSPYRTPKLQSHNHLRSHIALVLFVIVVWIICIELSIYF